MTTEARRRSYPYTGPKVLYRTSTMDPKLRFYRQFQDSVQVIQDLVSNLEGTANIGGERQAAIDYALAHISKLQNEVADASDFTPAYDRRQYAETLKTLQDSLNETIARVTPKPRFQFKRSGNTRHLDMGSPENDPRLHPGSLSRNPHVPPPQGPAPDSAAQSPSLTAAVVDSNDEEGADSVPELPSLPRPSSAKDYNAEMAQPSESSVRKPSFSAAREIGIAGQSGLHIILPPSASRATAAGSLTNLRRCIVDMSAPTAGATAFPGLALRNIRDSLVVAGRVQGAVHATALNNCVVVVTARQVRIHECIGVDFYLHCGSHPIIEDCKDVRFAPLPGHYMAEAEEGIDNQWDQVDDFKWLKAGHSPNWAVLPEDKRLGEEIWTKVVPGQPGMSAGETLTKVGIAKQ